MTRYFPLIFALTICAAALVSASTTAAEVANQTIVLQDQQPYFQGRYGAYASPWSTFFDHRLVRGTDFLDTITIDPATFPDGAMIDSRWPLTKPDKSGVWGYNAVSFGNYDGGHPPGLVPPHQVKSIRQLSERFAFRYKGVGNFNLLNEFYLTSRPGGVGAKVIEIGLFLHAPAVSMRFILGSKRIGTFTNSDGRHWLVTRAKNFVMIVSRDGADVPRGRMNLRRLLSFLIDNGVVTGEEWFSGIAFGMEPVEGAGENRLWIDHWDVEYR